MENVNKNTFITFSNGQKIPLIGLGTWQSDPGEVKKAIKAAIEFGYRHIDCAYVYQNEKEIGEALKELFDAGTVKREDLFITTKLGGIFHDPERVEHALKLSLKFLRLDYVNLYLMHSPMAYAYIDDVTTAPVQEDGMFAPDDVHYLETWKAMEDLVEKGLAKSIGVSNFNIKQLGEVLKVAKVPCVNNQFENHPFLDQTELIKYCKDNNVAVTAFSPLGSPGRPWATNENGNILKDPLVKEMADSKECTPAQLLIAYNLCQGLICIPKSKSVKRIEENFLAFNVQLTAEEIRKLDSLAKNNFRAFRFEFGLNNVHYPF